MTSDEPRILHRPGDAKGGFVAEGGDGSVLAQLTYSRAGESLIILDHTEVDDSLRGTGTGARLVEAAIAHARSSGVEVIPLCPFAKSVIARRPELQDVVR